MNSICVKFENLEYAKLFINNKSNFKNWVENFCKEKLEPYIDPAFKFSEVIRNIPEDISSYGILIIPYEQEIDCEVCIIHENNEIFFFNY
jgi:hypothetical protein